MLTTEQQAQVDSALARLNEVVGDAMETVGRLDAAGHFLTGKFFVAQITEGLARVVREEQSPFVNRAAAAARWFCSDAKVDEAVRLGILTKLDGPGGPLFEKAEGDSAIRQKRWKPYGKAEGRRKNAESRTASHVSGPPSPRPSPQGEGESSSVADDMSAESERQLQEALT